VESSPTATSITAEKVLCELLCAGRHLVLKARASDSSHGTDRVMEFLEQRSRESVEEDVSKVIVRLLDMAGPSPQHRMVAYSQVGESILSDLQTLVFNDNSARLKQLELHQAAAKAESDQLYRDLTQAVAARDLEIARLQEQQRLAEERLKGLSQTNSALQVEVEKLLRDRIQTHQSSVELRMQGLDFKAEVDRRCGVVLQSVQSRMGFVPVGIEKQIELLRALKVS
jgi:hypothetical protein